MPCLGAIASSRSLLRRSVCQRRSCPFNRLLQVPLIHLDAGETQAKLRARDRGRSQTHEGVGDDAGPSEPVQPQAHLWQLGRKGGWVWPLLRSALDGLVWDEPGIASTPHAGRSRLPSSDVGAVLITHADGLTGEGSVA